MSVCAYCGERRAVNADHVIPKSILRNRRLTSTRRGERFLMRSGATVPPHLLALAPSCYDCNHAKQARLLIPPSWEHLLDELNALGIGTFRVWDGDIEALRGVVR